MGHPASRKIE